MKVSGKKTLPTKKTSRGILATLEKVQMIKMGMRVLRKIKHVVDETLQNGD